MAIHFSDDMVNEIINEIKIIKTKIRTLATVIDDINVRLEQLEEEAEDNEDTSCADIRMLDYKLDNRFDILKSLIHRNHDIVTQLLGQKLKSDAEE